ncbi:Translation machinery-associated protein 46 [Wickerhamomyces ciferrii]|uniref:Translation machinery-associated protein 46 n=1 Tax=Wickerhamomyces ciferrii (strain ATCC 14091 / BCRC 22168 / CBS 111 / JCM 3599 / NBRC 0793 / NRRL Y-1031 F-60-10) TaxID=1206466 RepID=K0KFQ7_WICCF|nr:Translation machinery-associated protein 46 [Wickerhamomyces ciferrii]CCH41067.1 Translation machinery-associated protein 46 [Wickerhamomyces ciferrii]
MPPKKGGGKGKQQEPKKDKSQKAADKTFGLKNKNRSTKVQQYIKQVETQVTDAQKKKNAALQARRAEEKKAAEAAKAEAFRILNSQVEQKVPFGVDPKTVLCINFKNGNCPRGAKCKFSHDMNVGKKATKKDLYTDDRATKEADTMDQWDEDKLRDVIKSKHGNPKTTTDKVCKFFIEAVENGKYGWFWVCPNGGNECKYRHSLPEGFVLKTKEQKRLEKMEEDAQPKISLEEFLETERHKLPKTGLTPINVETFAKWKEGNKIKKLNDGKKDGKKLTGREIIQKKFLDKNYFENEDDSQSAFDLSQFKQALDPEDANIKDYGDGQNVTFEAKGETKPEINQPETQTETQTETKSEIKPETESITKESTTIETSG